MQTSPASAALPRAPGDACLLCGSTRRTYLFVVGRSRMTRCDECQLVTRSDEGRPSVEAESYALYFLQEEGVTRFDVVNFVSHGVSKVGADDDGFVMLHAAQSAMESKGGGG